VIVAPEIVGEEISGQERPEGAEESDAPAALDALQKVRRLLFEAQRKHDEDDADLGETTDELVGLGR